MPDLTGSTVLVVGGGRGIERAVELLVERGAHVVLHVDGDEERRTAVVLSASLALGGSTVVDSPARSCDDAQAFVDSVVAQRGAIDVLLTPVPPRTSASLAELDEAGWTDQLESCLKRSVGVLRGVARHRVAVGGGGRIVTFASSATFQSRGAGQASLNATMLSLTSAAALTLAEHGVPVNCVVLGGTDSPQGGVPQPDVEGEEILAATVVHLASTADPAVTGRYVYCAGRDVGLYAMPLVIESANVLMRFPDDVDPETVGHLLTPLVDVGRS